MKRFSVLPVGSDVSGKMLALAFAAVVGSFLVTSFIVQRSSAAVNALSEGIIYNSAPSIEHLASVRRAVLEAELLLSRFIHEPTLRPELGQQLEAALARVKQGTREYLVLAPAPGEQPVRLDVQEAWLHFDDAVRQVHETVGSGTEAESEALFTREVEPTGR